LQKATYHKTEIKNRFERGIKKWTHEKMETGCTCSVGRKIIQVCALRSRVFPFNMIQMKIVKIEI